MGTITYPLLVSALVLWYLISSIVAWYRLRHFPGPLLARFSHLHHLYTAFTKKAYLKYANLGQTYGQNARSLIRIGPNDLITSDPHIIRRMSAVRSYYRRAPWYLGMVVDPRSENIMGTVDVKWHNRLKRMTAPAYRKSSEVEEAIDSQLMALVDLFRREYLSEPEKQRYRPVNFGTICKLFTLDFATRLALGKETGCLATNSDVDGIIQYFDD
ncbi:hypothetical protein CDD82_7866 [Ophiocordyceps australis]|uniref:Cytochrome P450 n=1 Tax=Ophiocordyceps australis TaxID=1399860 RepID=A0A2C5YQS8_9HYPO|nr:hypothetical protein CDD82_7866 [Ophiocordyceps australis]